MTARAVLVALVCLLGLWSSTAAAMRAEVAASGMGLLQCARAGSALTAGLVHGALSCQAPLDGDMHMPLELPVCRNVFSAGDANEAHVQMVLVDGALDTPPHLAQGAPMHCGSFLVADAVSPARAMRKELDTTLRGTISSCLGMGHQRCKKSAEADSIPAAETARTLRRLLESLGGDVLLHEEDNTLTVSVHGKQATFDADTLLFAELAHLLRSPAQSEDGEVRDEALRAMRFSGLQRVQMYAGGQSELAEIAEVLLQRALEVSTEKREDGTPVITLLFHEPHIDFMDQVRNLASGSNDTNSTNETSPITMTEITNWQITTWTAITLILAALAAVCLLCTMDVQPDSLLFAKFQTSRGKND